MSGRLALGALALVALLACRGVPLPGPAPRPEPGGPPAASPGAGATPLLVVHRAARTAGGTLTAAATAALADAAALAAFPEMLPLDAWAALVPGDEPLALVSVPSGGEVAEAIATRLRAVAAGRPLAVIESPARPYGETLRGAAVLLVVTPSWEGGGLDPDPEAVAAELARRNGSAPRLVVADLTSVQVGAERWNADLLVAGTDSARVALVAEFVLAARAARELPDAKAMAQRRGLPAEAAAWETGVIAD
ncbi:MAG: hypothetical protein MUE47_06985 [Acidobacteria bacterium]|nr:hypothetical protein [Acidobacteriota bacterium]